MDKTKSLAKFSQSKLQKFYELMKDFNVIGFALALIITTNLTELSNAFIDGIIIPTIQPLIDKISDEGSGKIRLGKNIVINYQKFLSSLIKFIVFSILIFVAFSLGISIQKPISWVSVRSVAPNLT